MKRAGAWLLIASIMFAMLPTMTMFASAEGISKQVSTLEEFQEAIAVVDQNTIIDITADITIPYGYDDEIYYDVGYDYNYPVTIMSSNNSTLYLEDSLYVWHCPVLLKDLTICRNTPASKILMYDTDDCGAGSLAIQNVTFEDKCSDSSDPMIDAQYGSVTIYSVTFADPDSFGMWFVCEGVFSPEGNINIGKMKVAHGNAVKIIPHGDYTITKAILGDSGTSNAYDILGNINADGEYTLQGRDAAYSLTMEVRVPASSEEISTGGAVSEKGVHYAWSYGGAITEKDGDLIVTPFANGDVNYVIDAVYVDGVRQTIDDNTQALTVTDAKTSVFASFAYTVNFPNPQTASSPLGGEAQP